MSREEKMFNVAMTEIEIRNSSPKGEEAYSPTRSDYSC